MLQHALEITNTATWVGFNNKIVEDKNKKKKIIRYLTIISSTDKKVVLKNMKENEGLQKKNWLISMYHTIQQLLKLPCKFNQSIEKPVMLAYFKAVGNVIAGGGLINVADDCGSVQSFLTGKHFKRM